MKSYPISQFEELSPPAHALLHRMLDQQESPDDIRRAIFRLTGERVFVPAITHYASHYAQRSSEHQQARQEADRFVSLAGQRGVSVSALLRAALIERLVHLQRSEKLGDADLWKLADAERKRQEVALKRYQAKTENERRARDAEWKSRQAELGLQRKDRESDFKSQQAELERQRKERELNVKERQLHIAERKFLMERRRAKAALGQLERKARAGNRLSKDDVQRIREAYGIFATPPEERTHEHA